MNPEQRALEKAYKRGRKAGLKEAAKLICIGCADSRNFAPAELNELDGRYIHKSVNHKSRIWCDADAIIMEMNNEGKTKPS